MIGLPSVVARKLVLAVVATFILVAFFGFTTWHKLPQWSSPSHSKHIETPFSDDGAFNISELVRQLFEPIKGLPTESLVLEDDGVRIDLPPNPRYLTSLGSDVLILDLDTRPLASTEPPEHENYDWRNIDHVSAGVFSHYTYAMVHGYDYKFIHASEFQDRHATWVKPSAIANHIAKYKFIIFLDADATFRFLHLPIEWLLNYWNIKPHHSLVMAKDPWDEREPQYNSDRFNRTYTNTGFIIAQNTPNTIPILKAWQECPSDTRYPTCSQWNQQRFHEQSAFGEYIRYDYGDYIKELDCGEANGFPGVKVSQCEGKFIRHYWFQKHLVKLDYGRNMMNALDLPIKKLFSEAAIMNALTLPIHRLFLQKTGIVFTQEENIIHA
ncbi:hypothetical protein OPT61_g54 [Boeremia exigua]|uniref:Uncharacterized protein n=1 Tax=Boeremia exigua TaxID=749465 RepID=A0ACC2IVF3_9PLEO|nr:hypothetical protein OPT61_g54 [Boeremia exigua]